MVGDEEVRRVVSSISEIQECLGLASKECQWGNQNNKSNLGDDDESSHTNDNSLNNGSTGTGTGNNVGNGMGVVEARDTARARRVTDLSLRFLEFKSASRAAHLAVDRARRQVNARKRQLDGHHLLLQNLLYEKDHLGREIERCRDFTTRELDKVEQDDDVVIVENGALQGGGDDPAEAAQRTHKVHLDRLAHELAARKRLNVTLGELKERKRSVTEMLESTNAFLGGLPEQLQCIERASEPLQKFIKLKHTGPSSERRRLHAAAKRLPDRLYVLFCQLEAYTDAFGDEENTSVCVADSKDAGVEEESLTPFPQAVLLEMHVPVAVGLVSAAQQPPQTVSERLVVRFQFVPALGVITAEAEGHKGLLTNLYPEDSGEVTPLRTNHHDQQHCAAGGGDFFPASISGRPYRWAQWIAGSYQLADALVRLEPSTRTVVARIRARLRSSKALQLQLQALAASSKERPAAITVHPSVAARFASSPSTNASGGGTVLIKWMEGKEGGFENYFAPLDNKGDGGAPASSSSSSSSNGRFGCRYFKATFQHHKVQLNALVEVSPEYPVRAPRFILQNRTPPTQGATTTQGSVFDNQLKGIEIEVNAHYDELIGGEGSAEWLLSHQLRCVETCFDMLSDAQAGGGGADHGGEGFGLGRRRRGRDRRRPLAFDPHSKMYVHR